MRVQHFKDFSQHKKREGQHDEVIENFEYENSFIFIIDSFIFSPSRPKAFMDVERNFSF